MANDFREFANILKNIDKQVKKALRSREVPKDAGDIAKDMIQERTQKGFGIDKLEGKKRRLAKLAKSTKSIRRSEKKAGKLSDLTTPNRSNFTRTGRTLENMKVKPSNGKVKLSLDTHGQRAVKTTEAIPGKGRKFNFMGLSRTEVRKIKKFFEAELKRALKKYL